VSTTGSCEVRAWSIASASRSRASLTVISLMYEPYNCAQWQAGALHTLLVNREYDPAYEAR
jgi:hypothetical protein